MNMEPGATDPNSNPPPQPVVTTAGNSIDNILNQNPEVAVNEYVERLGTRLSMLETELKYAWRALDLLSQEYVKMWERLEKLEVLLYEQQTVISQLLQFYSNFENLGNQLTGAEHACDGEKTDIGAERTREEEEEAELDSVLHVTVDGARDGGMIFGSGLSREASEIIKELQLEDVLHISDEAFYKSLNKAYREDLVGGIAPSAASQLGMIWEEAEESEENLMKKEAAEDVIKQEEPQDIYSSLDYKDYRNNVPCINDEDLAQLSRLSAIDDSALEKLHELDKLTDKLQKNSDSLKELQNRLLDQTAEKDQRSIAEEDASAIDEQLRQIFSESDLEKWSLTSAPRDLTDVLILSGMTQKSESEPAQTSSTYMSSISPHSRLLDSSYSSPSRIPTDAQSYSPFASKRISSLDAYSHDNITGSPKHTVDYTYSSSNNSPKHGELQGYSYVGDATVPGIVSASFSTVACSSPSIYSVSSGKLSSSPTSIVSVRTRQDGFGAARMERSPSPSSPPPPAPQDKEVFMLQTETTENTLASSAALFGVAGASTSITSLSLDQQQGRLTPRTPHSPKSPRASPKRIVKSTSTSIAAAKSDSGLSSMSGGWSSLEKSPGSPKSGKPSTTSAYTISETGVLLGRVPCHTHSRSYSATHLNVSPKRRAKSPYRQDSDPYSYSRTLSPLHAAGTSSLLPGGHHMSAFTAVRTPTGLDSISPSVTNDSTGMFVPSPAPSSDVNTNSSRRSQRLTDYHTNLDGGSTDFMYRSEKSAIYSVAGSHRQPYVSAYTTGSSTYTPNVTHSGYPDLIGPYPISDTHSGSSSSSQYLAGSEQGTSRSHSASTSVYPTPTTTPTQYGKTGFSKQSPGVSHLDGYRTAMHRTMFPTGQITDALSYYPTSADTSTPAKVPTTYYQTPMQWLSRSVDSSAHPFDRKSTEVPHTKPSLMDPSAQFRGEEGYPIRDQWNRRDWNSELDIRNQNASYDDRFKEQFYGSQGVIVSQSGYISISSDLKEEHGGFDKQMKKGKRAASLKSAMNSVSNWLPDLHLNKRHRSNSLPANEFTNENGSKSKGSLRGKLQRQLTNTITRRRLAKSSLVVTVSGILQKAKKRAMQSSQSLSDPEQSEMEWGSSASGRISALSVGSEDSVFCDTTADIFAKMPVKTDASKPASPTPDSEQVTKLPELDLPVDSYSESEEPKIPESVTSLFPTVGEIKQSQKSTTGSSDESVKSENAMKFPQVNIGGPPREFAVSRALGKYRQRHSSNVSDEAAGLEENGKETLARTPEDAEEISKEETPPEESKAEAVQVQPPIIEPVVPPKMPQTVTPQTSEETAPIQSSPSLQSVRSSQRYVNTRHQQSLEIPWGFRSSGDGDDDTRSTHSWRSTSRVSSRRQSTEDSIDSEDEWYCYELRKLEELERQTQIEKETMEALEKYKPDEHVKEQMSIVLRELKLKTNQLLAEDDKTLRLTGVMREELDKEPKTLRSPIERRPSLEQRRSSMERRPSGERTTPERRPSPDRPGLERRPSLERPSLERRSSLERPSLERRLSIERPEMERRLSTDRPLTSERRKLPEMPERRLSFDRRAFRELPQRRNDLIQPMEIIKRESDEEKEHSSGDTSGPDSPNQSLDEMDYEEQPAGEPADNYRNKSGSISREESESVAPSEMSVSIQGEWNSEDATTAREGSVSVQGSEWENDARESESAPTTQPSQQQKAEDSGKEKEDGGKDICGVGSKWKLLKALKERKAEEKEAKAEAAKDENGAVSTEFPGSDSILQASYPFEFPRRRTLEMQISKFARSGT